MKKAMLAVAAAAMFSAPFTISLSGVFASSTPESSYSSVSKSSAAIVSSPDISTPAPAENQAVSLKTLLDNSPLAATQKEQVTEEIFAAAKHAATSDLYRSRYYTSSKKFSKAQVKKIAAQGNKANFISYFISAVPASLAFSVIATNYYGPFQTAAKHGWGIKITMKIDSYQPTTASTSYSFSYIK